MAQPVKGRTDVEPEFLIRERERVEEALRTVSIEATARIDGSLRAPVEYALATSGKRLRPILCVAAYRAANASTEVPAPVYRLACALEIVHTYSLIHDDLPCMDDDDLRRGRPTVHRVFGYAAATLAGAALLPLAISVLEAGGTELGLPVSKRAELVRELAAAAGATGMVGGQLLDLEAEQRDVTAGELERIHAAKTGALLTSSLRIGGMAGGADNALLDGLTRYGRALGLAFQITDDLLDVEGSSGEIGKTAGRDLALRKASYPALHGVEGARALAREQVERAKRALGDEGLRELTDLADFVLERRK